MSMRGIWGEKGKERREGGKGGVRLGQDRFICSAHLCNAVQYSLIQCVPVSVCRQGTAGCRSPTRDCPPPLPRTPRGGEGKGGRGEVRRREG